MKKRKNGVEEGKGGSSPSQQIDTRIEDVNDWRGETLARIRLLIKQADPEVVEEVKWRKPSNSMLGVPVWSHDGILCTGETYKKVVKLTFAILGVLLLVWLLAVSCMPLAGSPPVTKRFRFSIRYLLCLTTILFGITMFMVSGFECEAAEKASRPGPLPAVMFRHFVWEMESGLVCMTISGLDWISSALKCPKT